MLIVSYRFINNRIKLSTNYVEYFVHFNFSLSSLSPLSVMKLLRGSMPKNHVEDDNFDEIIQQVTEGIIS